MKKRILSFILSLAMLLSLLPVQVLAAAPSETATVIVRDEAGTPVTNASVVVSLNGTTYDVRENDGRYQFTKESVTQDTVYDITVEKIGFERQHVTMRGTSGSILVVMPVVTGHQWQAFKVLDENKKYLAEIEVDLLGLKNSNAATYQESNGNRWEFVPKGTDAAAVAAFSAAVWAWMDEESVERLEAAGLGSDFEITRLKEQMDGTCIAEGRITGNLVELYDKDGNFLGAGSGDAQNLYAQYLDQTIVWDGEVGFYSDNGSVYRIEIDEISNDKYKITALAEASDKYIVTYTDGVDGIEVFADEVHVSEGSLPEYKGDLEREGYSFNGWAMPDGSEPPDEVKNSITLHAVWLIAPQYTGTVKVYQGGSVSSAGEVNGSPKSIEAVLGSGAKLYVKSENGSTYMPLTSEVTGVYHAALENGKYYIYVSFDEETYTKLGNQILWMENASHTCYLFYNNTITYNLNGGEMDGSEGSIMTYGLTGSEVVINKQPVLEGSTFAGWKDSSGNVYQPGERLTADLAKNYTLTAQWIGSEALGEFSFTIADPSYLTLIYRLSSVDVEIVQDGEVVLTQNVSLSAANRETKVNVPVASGHYYSVNVVGYHFADGSCMPAENPSYGTIVSVDNIDAPGAYVDLLNKQQGAVTAQLVQISSYTITFYTAEGHFDGADIILNLPSQSRLPNLANYVPVAPEGREFAGWDWGTNRVLKTNDPLIGNLLLIATWKDASSDTPGTTPDEGEPSVPGVSGDTITVRGQVAVDNEYWQRNEDGTISHQTINPVDRVTNVTVLLQKAVGGTGYFETVAAQIVSWGDEQSAVKPETDERTCYCSDGCTEKLDITVVNYEFENLSADGRYRITVLSPNYTAYYQNETDSINMPEDYSTYKEGNYRANDEADGEDEEDDDVAVVNALIKFAPPSFNVEYIVDASQITTLHRPEKVEILVTYDKAFRNITDPSLWPVISQMDFKEAGYKGDSVVVNRGVGSSSYPVWTASSDGTEVYDYGIRVNKVDGVAYQNDDPRFSIEYVAPAHLDTLAGTNTQNQILKAVLVPRTYSITYELNGGSLAGQEHLHSYVWSHAEEIEEFNAVPTRNGYVFEGWEVKIGNGGRVELKEGVIPVGVTGDIVFYAKWSRVVVNLQVVLDHSGAAVDTSNLLETELTSRRAGTEDDFRPVAGDAYSKDYGSGIWYTNNPVDVVEIPHIYTAHDGSEDYKVNVELNSYYMVESYEFGTGNSASTGVVIGRDPNTGDDTIELEHNVVVCLKYDSDLLHLEFAIQVPLDADEAAARWPESVGVKVTCWDPETREWKIISQHEETRMEITIKNGRGEGKCAVRRWQNESTPNYYRIEVVSLNLENGKVVDLTEKTSEVLYGAPGYTAEVSVTNGAPAAEGALDGAFGQKDEVSQKGDLKAVIKMGKVIFHANKNDWEGTGDVFRTYYPAAEKGSSYSVYYLEDDASVKYFYDIPEFEYKTHNKYIFKGWYDSKDAETANAISWEDVYLYQNADDVDIYAHWIETGSVAKEPEDRKEIDRSEYDGFDLFGVQIRDAENDSHPHHGVAGSGLRFLASLSHEVRGQMLSLDPDFEYGFVVAPSVLVERAAAGNSDYVLQFKDKNVNGVDTRSTHSYVSNQKCNGLDQKGEVVTDHYEGTNYNIFTVVVTYKGLEGENLAKAYETDFTVRAYARYEDANNLLRTYHNNYSGTVHYGGVSISYADVKKVVAQKAVAGGS